MQLNPPTHEPSPHHDHAFTLVEMLLVLTILTILAAIVYPKITERAVYARNSAAKVQLKAFQSALELFDVDNGYFPSTHEGLSALIDRPKEAQNWHGPYLDHLPKDPWGSEYVYTCPGKHRPNSFDLMSPGKDRQADTDDDLTNWQVEKGVAATK